ncbi:MAG TPA: DUF4124 domain-containing protein [Povalibacter sp.]
MRTLSLLLVLLAAPVLAGQTVWKWVDADGVTHYTDRPVPGATRMELSTGSTVAGSTYTPPSSPNVSSPQDPAAASPAYRNFEIWKPADEETIANTGGHVTVNIRLEPSLQPGHSLFLYMDGKLVEGYPQDALSFDLTEVARGTHRVVAMVNDGKGNRLRETAPVTFHVQQQSAATPPTGPSLRPPPPKPQPRAGNKMLTSQPTYAALNPVPSAPIDPATNRPVVTKPATKKPTTPAARHGK